MVTVNIDETTELGKRILHELAENPSAGQVCSMIPRDENGVPIGTRWEDIRDRMYDNLSKHYGVDLRTL